ncbi:MAG: GNAT family N-acetyltransferase [Pelagibacteraceae bacterium]|jgi:ribosomal protein S18 acetylase RimI-like enzyme|nr:GNAT family N-acetyltransferase [Pelagibacteraceae bacterium]
MKIEMATTSDIPMLCTLLDYLFSQEVEFKPDHETQSRGLEMILNNNNIGNIFVAKKNEKTIGMVILLYTASTALGERVALLEDMVVSPNERGLGIGSMLLDHAVKYATEEGCKRITLLTDKTNIGAQKFYKQHEFNRSSMIPFRMIINKR